MDGAATGSPVLLSGVMGVSVFSVSPVEAAACPVAEVSVFSVSSVGATACPVADVSSEASPVSVSPAGVSAAGVTGSTDGISDTGIAVSVTDAGVPPGSTGVEVAEEG